MADEGSTTKQRGDDDESGVHRLRDIVVEEVSLVDRAANKRRFLLVKRSSQMAENGKPKGSTSQEGRTGAMSGTHRKKPRPNPDENVDKARPRVMRAGPDDEEDDDEETEKARRSAASDDEQDDDEGTEKARRSPASDDEQDDEETEKARRSPASDDEQDDDTDTEKARRPAPADDEQDDDDTEKARRSAPADDEQDDDDAKKANGNGDEQDEDEQNPAKGPSAGKRSAHAGGGSRNERPGRAGKRTSKSDDDAVVLPAAVKNAVLRTLAQVLERLMAIANQVKEADEPDDETQADAPDDMLDELEDCHELLTDVGEQLAGPAEKSHDKKPRSAKERSGKADLSKAGRRMAKDRLERFQKALELLAAVLKELTEENPAPTPSAGSAGKPLGKRESPDVGQLVTSVQDLTRIVKRQEEQLVALQKTRATSNAIPVEGTRRRREIQEVSWPLDMNRPISRERVDKAISFYDED